MIGLSLYFNHVSSSAPYH